MVLYIFILLYGAGHLKCKTKPRLPDDVKCNNKIADKAPSEINSNAPGWADLLAAYHSWDQRHWWMSLWSSLLATIALVFSFFCLRFFRRLPRPPSAGDAPRDGKGSKPVAVPVALLLLAWTIGPPMWFLSEYMIFCVRLAPDQLEDLRHFEELTRNMWIAIVAGLVAVYAGKVPGVSE